MSVPLEAVSAVPATDTEYSLLDRALRARLLNQMRALRECRLTIIDALGATTLGSAHADDAEILVATLTVHSSGFYRAVATNGSVGAGESYIDGDWQCDDLVALIRMLVRNR